MPLPGIRLSFQGQPDVIDVIHEDCSSVRHQRTRYGPRSKHLAPVDKAGGGPSVGYEKCLTLS